MKLIVHGATDTTGEFVVAIDGGTASRNFSKGLTAYETAHEIARFLEETTELGTGPATEPEIVPDVPAPKKSKAPPKDAA